MLCPIHRTFYQTISLLYRCNIPEISDIVLSALVAGVLPPEELAAAYMLHMAYAACHLNHDVLMFKTKPCTSVLLMYLAVMLNVYFTHYTHRVYVYAQHRDWFTKTGSSSQ